MRLLERVCVRGLSVLYDNNSVPHSTHEYHFILCVFGLFAGGILAIISTLADIFQTARHNYSPSGMFHGVSAGGGGGRNAKIWRLVYVCHGQSIGARRSIKRATDPGRMARRMGKIPKFVKTGGRRCRTKTLTLTGFRS